MISGRELISGLRGLPKRQKEIIVWGATILVAIGLFAWWVPRMSERLKIQQTPGPEAQFQFDALKEQLQHIPLQRNGEQ